MMKRFLQPDSGLIRFLTRTCDLILLNLALVLSCMTIVCSGAAVTALYAVVLKWRQDETDTVVRDFLRALRDNFIPAFPATLLLFVDVLLLAVLRYALYAETLLFSPNLFVFLAILAVFLTALLSYLFPLTARYDSPFPRQLENAARLALANLPVTFLLTAVNLLPLLAGMLFPGLWGYVIGFWLLLGAAAGAYLNAFYLIRIFSKNE